MFDKKLQLKPEMRRSYLIQRMQKPLMHNGKVFDNPFCFGGGLVNGGLSKDAMGLLGQILSFDYMGSAEFEWGAVPNALSFIAEQSQKENIVSGEITLGGKPVYYVCPKPYEDAVKVRIQELFDNEHELRLKERCGLRDCIEAKREWSTRNIGWLELDNGFLFFTDREMFDGFLKLFGVKETTPCQP